jgi:hypothetical protein
MQLEKKLNTYLTVFYHLPFIPNNGANVIHTVQYLFSFKVFGKLFMLISNKAAMNILRHCFWYSYICLYKKFLVVQKIEKRSIWIFNFQSYCQIVLQVMFTVFFR